MCNTRVKTTALHTSQGLWSPGGIDHMGLQIIPGSDDSHYPGSTSHARITAQSLQAPFDPHWIPVADIEDTHHGAIDNSADCP